MKDARRGLTLIEVLAALVLLALTSTACISILRDARAQLDEMTVLDQALLFDLGLLADDIVADPAPYDLVRGADTDTTIVWPVEYGQSGVVRVRTVPHDDHFAGSDSSTTLRVWIAFSTSGASVVRWVDVPDEGGAP